MTTRYRLEETTPMLVILGISLVVFITALVCVNLLLTLSQIDKARDFSEESKNFSSQNGKITRATLCVLSVPAVQRTNQDIQMCYQKHGVENLV